MICDVKMEDFRRKARFVSGGHTAATPHAMTYASVVSPELVRIALTLAALNDLEVKMADIENAYLTAPLLSKCGASLALSLVKTRERKPLLFKPYTVLNSQAQHSGTISLSA
jgi:hypothetical protein